MIKIQFLEDGIYQESGYPLLFFEGLNTNEDSFIHLNEIVQKMSIQDFSFEFSSRPDLYELVNIDSIKFESKTGKNILSKSDNKCKNFVTVLDQKYWKYFGELTQIMLTIQNGHIYSDDSVMTPILHELEDNFTIIFDK